MRLALHVADVVKKLLMLTVETRLPPAALGGFCDNTVNIRPISIERFVVLAFCRRSHLSKVNIQYIICYQETTVCLKISYSGKHSTTGCIVK